LLVLEFAHATSWRVEGAGAKHFEVAGDDRMFHPATVRIDGAKLVLSSPAVSSPRYARFAHAADAMANLWNDHGLPPPPFGIEASR
jgi:sialate O-acetylesterase